MGLLECASGASMWRGYDYYNEKRVNIIEKLSDTVYRAKVSGNSATSYTVEIDIEHPRKSKCNCPHADGRRIICKHMVALYFAAFPQEAVRVYNEAIEYEKEEEIYQEQMENKLIKYINSMKKDEIREALINILYSGPEWQYDRFIRDYVGWD